MHPVAHLLRAELVQRGAQAVRLFAITRDEFLIAFRMRDIHATTASEQEFAADRWHGVEQFHARASGSRRLRRHQAGRTAADNRDVGSNRDGSRHISTGATGWKTPAF